MPRTFLPKLKAKGGIALPETYSDQFVAGTEALLDELWKNMEVPEANSEGRTPSPFARVWQFHRSLKNEAGRQEHQDAIAEFRGILALFALRQYYHITIEADVTPRLKAQKNEKAGQKLITDLFEVHTACVPESNRATAAKFLFGERIVLFRIVEPGGAPGTVFAGYSPLTLFFPAAKDLMSSQALAAIFWYDIQSGRWRDPTAGYSDEQRRLPEKAKTLLSSWLDNILAASLTGGSIAILDKDRLAPSDDKLIVDLLTTWRRELEAGAGGVQVYESAIPKSKRVSEVETSEGHVFEIPSLFTRVTGGLPPPSDFRSRAGCLVLSLKEVAKESRLVYGNIFGSAQVRAALESAPVEGADLGVALNRPGQAPIPYVVIDRLFCEHLGRVQEGQKAIGDGWFALQSDDARLGGTFLLPFAPAILRYFSAAELIKGTTIEDNIGALRVLFKNAESDVDIQRSYEAPLIKSLDPSLDLRFFPNFRLDSLSDLEHQLPDALNDRRYYARVRLSPELDQLRLNWLDASGTTFTDAETYTEGTFERPADRRFLALGKQAFWRLPAHKAPVAFQIEGFGLIPLTLVNLQREDRPSAWSVGLDFGTTNSCVAIDRGAGTNPTAFKLPVLTSTFLSPFGTQLRGQSDEGYSALADFFFWQNTATEVLNENEFFPTQVLTKLSLEIDRLPYPGFNERNGLAFFPNVSLAAVDNKGFSDLIEGFEALRDPESNLKPRFHLNRDLKWKDEGEEAGNSLLWRKVFHQHLRLHLIVAAARENAYIHRLVASYPKAFLPKEKTDYEEELREIWGEKVTVEIHSESAAAAMTLEVSQGQEFFVLDMGGGTTDIAVFKDEILEEECSMEVAAGILEKYVCQSDALRSKILSALEIPNELARLAAAFKQPQQDEQVYRTLFQGFLTKMEGPKGLSKLLTVGRSDVATQGFMLSSILLYTGLAYFCGLWLSIRRKTNAGIHADEYLQWLGNGSSFIRMFKIGGQSFENVLAQMFNEASQASVRVSELRPDAKTVVAKGLLKGRIHEAATEHEVFSNLLSNSISLDGRRREAGETLTSFYQEFARSRNTLAWDGLAEGTIFKGFLDALQKCLKAAHFNQTPLVRLEILGIQRPDQWAVNYVESNRDAFSRKLRQRLIHNESRWSSVIQRGVPGTLHVEPLFVSEIVALLDQIRDGCAIDPHHI